MALAALVLRLLPSGTPIISSGRTDYRFLRRMGPVKLVYASKFDSGDFAELRGAGDRCGPKRLLYVGRIAPEKGLEVLLDALRRVRDRGGSADVSLTMVGADFHGSSYAERFERRLDASGLRPHVNLVGYIPFGPALFEQYDSHDAFVLPSYTEGFPQVIFEAMIRGLPVVSTCVGGIGAVVRDGENGLLVAPRDAGALAGAIGRILGDRSLAMQLAKAGQETARRYTRSSQVDGVAEFLRSCFPHRLAVRGARD
jgi:glycosyltransferase involved in cell wall biosynthesis